MATYIEGALKSILQAASAVSNIVGTRVFWQRAPVRASLPCIIYFAVADPHRPLYFDPDGVKTKSGQRVFQFTCVSARNLESLGLQQAVMNTLRWAQGTTYGFTIETIGIENMRQRLDPNTDLFVCDVDAMVEYFEA